TWSVGGSLRGAVARAVWHARRASVVARGSIDRARFHGERDALALDIHILDPHLYDIAGLHHLARVLDEAIRQLGDVHQPVLMHADIDEGAERSDVGDDPFELHPGLQVRDFLDALPE